MSTGRTNFETPCCGSTWNKGHTDLLCLITTLPGRLYMLYHPWICINMKHILAECNFNVHRENQLWDSLLCSLSHRTPGLNFTTEPRKTLVAIIKIDFFVYIKIDINLNGWSCTKKWMRYKQNLLFFKFFFVFESCLIHCWFTTTSVFVNHISLFQFTLNVTIFQCILSFLNEK